jgi:hypothetical protein
LRAALPFDADRRRRSLETGQTATAIRQGLGVVIAGADRPIAMQRGEKFG